MEEFKETEPTSTLPDSLPVENPVLQRQDAVEVQEVAPVLEPKKKRVLSEAQKENLKLGRAIARKNREEKAKAKLDQMVDDYLKPFANKEEEEKKQTEPVEEEKMPPPPPVPQLKKTKKTRPTSPYTTPEESQHSKEESADEYPLLALLDSSEESEGWLTPPTKKPKQTWKEAATMKRAMTMPLPASTRVKKNRIAPVKFI